MSTRSASPEPEKTYSNIIHPTSDSNIVNDNLAKIPSIRSHHAPDPEQAPPSSPSDPSDTRSVRGPKWFLICASLYISALIYGLDTTIAADVQAAVVGTFHDVPRLTWMGAGFSLGSVATILPIASVYGKYNQKWVYIASIALFEAGSALCGGAPSMRALIVGRVVAGIGGSGVYLGVLNYLSVTTTVRERGAYIALIGVIWGLGCILGPVVGGAFSDSGATWRWAFYINLVIAAVSAPVYLIYLPDLRPSQGVSVTARLAKIDWLGFVLSAAFWVAFALALTSAGNIWGWDDGRTIASLVVCGVLIVLFGLQQKFLILTTLKDRSFPLHLLGSSSQVLLYSGTASAITGLFIPVYYLPLFFQFVKSDSALDAAVRLLPFVLVAISTNMATGVLLPKLGGLYMPVYLISGLFMVAGGAALYTVKADTHVANIYGYSVLAAIGAGMTLQTGYSVAAIKVKSPSDILGAISLQNVSQIGSTVIALVISGQVFQSYAFSGLKEVLAGRGFNDTDIRAAVAGAQSTVFENIEGALREQAIGAITDAMQKVYILVIVAGAVLVVSSLGMRRERLMVGPAVGG